MAIHAIRFINKYHDYSVGSRPELCVNIKKGVQLKRKFVIFDLRKKHLQTIF